MTKPFDGASVTTTLSLISPSQCRVPKYTCVLHPSLLTFVSWPPTRLNFLSLSGVGGGAGGPLRFAGVADDPFSSGTDFFAGAGTGGPFFGGPVAAALGGAAVAPVAVFLAGTAGAALDLGGGPALAPVFFGGGPDIEGEWKAWT